MTRVRNRTHTPKSVAELTINQTQKSVAELETSIPPQQAAAKLTTSTQTQSAAAEKDDSRKLAGAFYGIITRASIVALTAGGLVRLIDRLLWQRLLSGLHEHIETKTYEHTHIYPPRLVVKGKHLQVGERKKACTAPKHEWN